ncbi:MAG: polyprenyl synthetase family protein [Alphaproteobacteria bacterium]|nr:polyprenyl synthetase family protein [Alphaproteobacteria bacterium]
MLALEKALRTTAQDVEDVLDKILRVEEGHEARLFESMRYATLGGGKRFRPFLVVQSAALFSVSRTSALRVAAAIELVHCYSLVHDDLPAMDDDDLRRGQPTVHKQFDEATAILAGDALLTMAFEVLADRRTHENGNVRAELVAALASAAGAHGMVGGQMLDLEAEKIELDIGGITRLQRLKTGALIAFSCEAGAILGRASSDAREALRGYAHDLGLTFQIADDLLDVEGTIEETGKAVGKDAVAGKATFVSILGVERARAQAKLLANQAAEHLAAFDESADPLRAAANFVVERRN